LDLSRDLTETGCYVFGIIIIIIIIIIIVVIIGARGSIVVKALCHNPKGRWFMTRCGE
jgi:hypothetical protein